MADSPDIRIGNAERTRALDLLGEHFAAGRLTLTEFDERSAKASAATTRADLDVLFADLPEVTAATPATTRDLPVVSVDKDPERWRKVVVALTPLVALLLFFVFDSWLFFLLIPAVSIVLYGGSRRRGESC
ncbi:DUF1707 domain-containing protein [Rhodococcus sp. Z13]|uniref:DUF1707 domain-containing protein n=1 Tax=Rhodococcus sacchari TaxID=2962047 RepID=A0ACD4DCR9_9NOCA|nr:DUF1707 domain-containing protein [Rhodococcus sp. Z13]UYP17867.1 DUF1707 domain-containing protein [Rhodococcus sp. Z13]